MGNLGSAPQKTSDDQTLNVLEQSTETLRREIEQNPYDLDHVGHKLEKTEKAVHQILRRSKSQQQLVRCEHLIRNLEDLKDIRGLQERESNLSTGALESTSSFAHGNPKAYDFRILQRKFRDIETKCNKLGRKLNNPRIGGRDLFNLETALRKLQSTIANLEVHDGQGRDTQSRYARRVDDYLDRVGQLRSKMGRKIGNSVELRPKRPRSQSLGSRSVRKEERGHGAEGRGQLDAKSGPGQRNDHLDHKHQNLDQKSQHLDERHQNLDQKQQNNQKQQNLEQKHQNLDQKHQNLDQKGQNFNKKDQSLESNKHFDSQKKNFDPRSENLNPRLTQSRSQPNLAHLEKQNKRIEFETKIATIASQIPSWKDESENFKYHSDGPEYNIFRDTLIKSIDDLSHINDSKLQEARDSTIKDIQDCLKTLNMKSIKNLSGSLSRTGTLRDVELLKFHLEKIQHSLAKGRVKAREQVRHTLIDIHQTLNDILYGPELVTAKIVATEELASADVKVSRETLLTRSAADLLYLEEDDVSEVKRRNRLSLPRMPKKFGQENNFLDYPDSIGSGESKTDSWQRISSNEDRQNDQTKEQRKELKKDVDLEHLEFEPRNLEMKSQGSNLHISTPLIQHATSSTVLNAKPEVCSVITKTPTLPKVDSTRLHSMETLNSRETQNSKETLEQCQMKALDIEQEVRQFRGTKDDQRYGELDQRIIDLVIQLDKMKVHWDKVQQKGGVQNEHQRRWPNKELSQKQYEIMMILHRSARTLDVLTDLQELHYRLDDLMLLMHRSTFQSKVDGEYMHFDRSLTKLYEELDALQLGVDPLPEVVDLQRQAAAKIEEIAFIQGQKLEVIGTEV